jgi:hypothetical protein
MYCLIIGNTLQSTKQEAFMTEKFWKLFPEFIDKLALVSDSKQMLVILYVLRNLNDSNLYVGTIQSTADRTGVSYGTVKNTFKALREHDVLRAKTAGTLMWNPALMMRGLPVTKARLVAEYKMLGRVCAS